MRLPGTFSSVSAAITRCLQLLTPHIRSAYEGKIPETTDEQEEWVTASRYIHKRQQTQQSYLHSGTRLELVRVFFFELYIFSACISSRSSFPAPRIIPLTKTKNRPTSYLGSAICFQWFNHIFCSFDLVWNISLLPRPSCLEYPSCALSSGKVACICVLLVGYENFLQRPHADTHAW